MDNLKKCICCLTEKDRTEFSKETRRKDGLSLYCKLCKNANARISDIKNRTRKLKYMEEYNKKRKEIRAAYYKIYGQEKKQIISQRNRAHYERNIDRYKENHKIWYNNNKAKSAELVAKRRSRVLKNGIYKVSEKEITKLLSSNCYICQANPSEHLDHIVPISKGGTHSIGNLLGACQRCNLEKGSKTLYEYKRTKKGR